MTPVVSLDGGVRVSGSGTAIGVANSVSIFHTSITKTTAGIVAPPVPVPRQLPPTVMRFVGRAAEITMLDRVAAGDGRPKLVVLTGTGGAGKTTVAVAWAWRNADRYPDGHLYADLRGFSVEGAVLPRDVLGSFLRALGVSAERVPVELAERVALFRSATADKRLLVVLDNALSAAQVRVLLPSSAASMVLITSRLRLSGLSLDGARFMDVGPLRQAQAVQLLASMVGRRRAAKESARLDELAALCDRLPIALSVAGARLASRPTWTVERMVTELSDERARLARLSVDGDVSVGAAIDLSYQVLPENTARLYRLASAHPGPEIGRGAVAAAAEISEEDAERALQALVEANLLEELGSDRYRFHDLVRLHARAQPDAERDAACQRIGEWFLHTMTRANMMVIPIRWRVGTVCERYRDAPALFADRKEAVGWLDTHLPSFLAVLRDAVDRGWDELAWQVCEALWELFVFRKHYRDWIASHELGIGAAQRCGNLVAESRLRCQLGRAYLDLERFADAERESEQARLLACQAGDRRNESVALQQLGLAAEGVGDTDGAVGYLSRSLLIEQELGIERGVALRNQRIGEVLAGAGRDAEAATHLESAWSVFAGLSDPRDEAQVLISLARLDSRAGRLKSATSRLDRALQVLSEVGSVVFHADVLVAYGEISRDHGDVDAARRYLSQAWELYRDVCGPQAEQIQTRLALLNQTEPG